MSPMPRDAGRLRADLEELKASLRTVAASPPDDGALRAQFRDAAQRRAQAAARAGDGSWRIHAAAAAVLVLAVGSVIVALALRVEAPAPVPLAEEVSEAAPLPVAFQPLSSSPKLSPASEYSVVRVRIPLSAFALVPGTEHEGSIEAELLVGEDGLARAIRFNEADALRVSVAGQ